MQELFIRNSSGNVIGSVSISAPENVLFYLQPESGVLVRVFIKGTKRVVLIDSTEFLTYYNANTTPKTFTYYRQDGQRMGTFGMYSTDVITSLCYTKSMYVPGIQLVQPFMVGFEEFKQEVFLSKEELEDYLISFAVIASRTDPIL